ncbi:hypothetical protein Tco_0592361 [Tanacetum coccineum]
MAAVEVPQTLEYRGGQLNAAPVLENSNMKKTLETIFMRLEKNKSFVSATPLSTAFFSSSIVQDFQDSPDDEEDTRNS